MADVQRAHDPRSRLATDLTSATLVDGGHVEVVVVSPSDVAPCSPAPSLSPSEPDSPPLQPTRVPKPPPPSPLNYSPLKAAPPLTLPPSLAEGLSPGSFSDS